MDMKGCGLDEDNYNLWKFKIPKRNDGDSPKISF